MVRNYINGEWVGSQGSGLVHVLNPANGKVLDECPLGNSADVGLAVEAARTAFTQWRRVPAADRVQFLFKLKTLMEQHQEDLSRTITSENGKTLAEARGSVRRAIQMVETACSIPTLMMGKCSEDIAPGIDCFAFRRPMGVFAAITPNNFPSMVACWFWPFAVASGNTFIVKPSERVPLSQVKFFKLIHEAGFPKGVLNLVHGAKETVDAILSHPCIAGVSFVGSTPVAKHVYQTGAFYGKRVQALGGAKNFMVVLPDAIMERAVPTAFESIVGCAGQRCLAGSVVLCVGDKTYQEVQERIVRLAREVIVGDGMERFTQMGPVISQASKDRIKELIQSAIDEGATALEDGRFAMDGHEGFFLRPTVLSGIKPDMRISQEEVFGPVVCLAKVKSFDDAIRWLNSSPYGNTTTLFTSSGAAVRKFCYEVEPSMIGINIGVPAPMAFFSFGGSRDSFFGDLKAHGAASIDFYTDTKVTIQRWMSDSGIW